MTKSRIKALENWRRENSKTKAWMARYFDVNNRNYNNWVYRNSLPKEYIDTADKLLKSLTPSTPALALSPEESDLVEHYRLASPEMKKAVIRLLVN